MGADFILHKDCSCSNKSTPMEITLVYSEAELSQSSHPPLKDTMSQYLYWGGGGSFHHLSLGDTFKPQFWELWEYAELIVGCQVGKFIHRGPVNDEAAGVDPGDAFVSDFVR